MKEVIIFIYYAALTPQNQFEGENPNEVTPEQCHQIGIELARRLWGNRYEVLVATHLNTDCCHNHFVLSSVSFVDGRKFNGNRASYYALREASDELCREYGLSVIEEPSHAKTPRKIFEDEKAGRPTRYNIARQDIEAAVLTSASWQVFLQVMGKLGYEIQVSHTGHLTIKAQGWKYPVRMDSLGSEYAPKNLYHTIMVGKIYYKFVGAIVDDAPFTPTKRYSEPIHKTCANCGKEFVAGGNSAKYCPDCRPVMRKQKVREADAKRTIARREQRQLSGTQGYREKACKCCGKLFKPNGGNSAYCSECKALTRQQRESRHRES